MDAVTAVAVAPDPPPPEIAIDGTEVYPEPAAVIVIELTALLVRTAVPVAPDPPPPLKATVGTDE